MAQQADYGFILWDGKSPGSFNNLLELLKQNKPALVYFTPEQRFYPATQVQHAQLLMQKCNTHTQTAINQKTQAKQVLRTLQQPAQTSLLLP